MKNYHGMKKNNYQNIAIVISIKMIVLSTKHLVAIMNRTVYIQIRRIISLKVL